METATNPTTFKSWTAAIVDRYGDIGDAHTGGGTGGVEDIPVAAYNTEGIERVSVRVSERRNVVEVVAQGRPGVTLWKITYEMDCTPVWAVEAVTAAVLAGGRI